MRKFRKKQNDKTPKRAQKTARRSATRSGVVCALGAPMVSHFYYQSRITNKFTQPLGADSLSFLRYCLGARFKITQAKGWSSGMIFKKPGEPVFVSNLTWSPQLLFSLRFSSSQQNFLSGVNRNPSPLLPPIVEGILTQRASDLTRSFTQKETLKTLEKKHRVFSDRTSTTETNNTVTREVNFGTILPGESKWIASHTIDRLHRLRDESLLRTETSHFVLLRHSDQREVTNSFSVEIGKPVIDLPRPFNPVINAKIFSGHPLANGPSQVEIKPAADDLTALLLNRQLVESALPRIEEAGESQAQSIAWEPTFLHREEPVSPAPVDYVFAKPLRLTAAEEQVVKRVEEREVVEVVKKEVQTILSSGSVMQSFSRADYGRIADHVYSDLVRRLMVEKERLSLR